MNLTKLLALSCVFAYSAFFGMKFGVGLSPAEFQGQLYQNCNLEFGT
jgi:hypothetical protein